MTDAPTPHPAKGLIIIPHVECWDLTCDAINDALAQLSSTADVLLITNGTPWPKKYSRHLSTASRLRYWSCDPPLPSLAATWNTALDFAWAAGYPDAMIWNNDIRVGSWMYADLRAAAERFDLWFATPVNCRDAEDPEAWKTQVPVPSDPSALGGPDFSCFLIRPEAHRRYRFDERFQPAYFEDGDYHRRLWLEGDGKRIAGLPLPYLHYGSRTINRSAAASRAFSPKFEACRERYIQKWGGTAHQERFVRPDDPTSARDEVGTPGGYLSMDPPQVDPLPSVSFEEGVSR